MKRIKWKPQGNCIDNMWYFYDNNLKEYIGPFETKEECQKESNYYRFNVPHLGCYNYPNCDIAGCGD